MFNCVTPLNHYSMTYSIPCVDRWFVLLPSAALGGAAAYGEFVDPEFKKLMEQNVYTPFQDYIYNPIMELMSGSGKSSEEEQKPLAKVIQTKVLYWVILTIINTCITCS